MAASRALLPSGGRTRSCAPVGAYVRLVWWMFQEQKNVPFASVRMPAWYVEPVRNDIARLYPGVTTVVVDNRADSCRVLFYRVPDVVPDPKE